MLTITPRPEQAAKQFRKIRRDMLGGIQDYKIAVDRGVKNNLQSSGAAPPDKYLISYVGSQARGKRYVNIDRFYDNMARSYVKNWKKSFIHTSTAEVTNERIAEAALFAYTLIKQRTAGYPRYSESGWKPTGILDSSVRQYVNGRETTNPRPDILASTGSPIVEFTNIAEYASTVEARSYFRDGGILFYAAKRTANRYKDLGVIFTYAAAKAFGAPHKYELPVLVISDAQTADGKWSRPGVRARARARIIRRVRRRNTNGAE